MNRHTLPLDSIIVQDRQRDLNLSHVADLADSIKRLGLIQPIVINQENRLIAGGHRLAACRQLGLTTIDIVYKETLSEYELQELELTENLKRANLTWQEQVKAVAKIHALKKRSAALDSKSWGQRETGDLLGITQGYVSYSIIIARHLEADDKEIVAAENPNEAWSIIMRRDAELAQAELAQRHMQKAASTAEEDSFLDFSEPTESFESPSVADCGHTITATEIEQTYDTQLQQIRKERQGLDYFLEVNEYPHLINRVKQHYIASGKEESTFDTYWKQKLYDAEHQEFSINLTEHYIHSDCIPYMWSKPEAFDHIITDIPYGIDIEQIDQSNSIPDIATIKAEHTVEGNKELFKLFFPAAYNCLKPNAFLITWCDQMLWQEMHDLAIAAGFKVQRWPFIWCKDYPCLNQMAQTNFTKSTEIAMVCRKGVITLPEKQSNNYIIASRDEMCKQLNHPFAKPFAIWERLFKAVSIENQSILDPFCGRGSGFISGVKLGRNMYGVEKDDAHFNAGLENLKTFYLGINPKYTFK